VLEIVELRCRRSTCPYCWKSRSTWARQRAGRIGAAPRRIESICLERDGDGLSRQLATQPPHAPRGLMNRRRGDWPASCTSAKCWARCTPGRWRSPAPSRAARELVLRAGHQPRRSPRCELLPGEPRAHCAGGGRVRRADGASSPSRTSSRRSSASSPRPAEAPRRSPGMRTAPPPRRARCGARSKPALGLSLPTDGPKT